MHHTPFDELLSAYFDGEATAEERERVERLLESSPEARRQLDELGALSDLVRSLPRDSAPVELAASIRAGAERESLLGSVPAAATGVSPAAALTTPNATPAATPTAALRPASRGRGWITIVGTAVASAAAALAAVQLFPPRTGPGASRDGDLVAAGPQKQSGQASGDGTLLSAHAEGGGPGTVAVSVRNGWSGNEAPADPFADESQGAGSRLARSTERAAAAPAIASPAAAFPATDPTGTAPTASGRFAGGSPAPPGAPPSPDGRALADQNVASRKRTDAETERRADELAATRGPARGGHPVEKQDVAASRDASMSDAKSQPAESSRTEGKPMPVPAGAPGGIGRVASATTAGAPANAGDAYHRALVNGPVGSLAANLYAGNSNGVHSGLGLIGQTIPYFVNDDGRVAVVEMVVLDAEQMVGSFQLLLTAKNVAALGDGDDRRELLKHAGNRAEGDQNLRGAGRLDRAMTERNRANAADRESAPAYYVYVDASVDQVVAALEELQKQEQERPSVIDVKVAPPVTLALGDNRLQEAIDRRRMANANAPDDSPVAYRQQKEQLESAIARRFNVSGLEAAERASDPSENVAMAEIPGGRDEAFGGQRSLAAPAARPAQLPAPQPTAPVAPGAATVSAPAEPGFDRAKDAADKAEAGRFANAATRDLRRSYQMLLEPAREELAQEADRDGQKSRELKKAGEPVVRKPANGAIAPRPGEPPGEEKPLAKADALQVPEAEQRRKGTYNVAPSDEAPRTGQVRVVFVFQQPPPGEPAGSDPAMPASAPVAEPPAPGRGK